MEHISDKILLTVSRIVTAFFEMTGDLADRFGFDVGMKKLMAIQVVAVIWTAIAALITSCCMIPELKKKRSAPCMIAMCVCVTLAVIEIVLTVVCIPAAAVLPIVNIVHIIFAVMVLVHMRKRKGKLCRLAAAVLMILSAATLLLSGMIFTAAAG
ncbi:hypothetical protein [uncultured Ruminococcus sp.]|uniref:hypothetical protein n=1 Tax=uncultured Ruminococcus sp. TaxID=165186 RepID=UPI0025F94C73|nr:hypothetical protein [uncultured Ruminococcus sp.]